MIRWIVRVGVAVIMLATLGGSLPASAQADSLNVDYVGWHLASNRIDVDKVVLSFDADLIGEYEVTVELLDNDKNVVSSGKGVFTDVTKEDKLVIDLSDAPIELVYYIRVTVGKLPSVMTLIARPVGSDWTVLRGTLTDMGTASSVDVSFEWGETIAYGSMTPVQTMTHPGAFWATITGLTPDTTYHFRSVAVGDGTSYGLDRTFTTISRTRPSRGGGPSPPPQEEEGTTDVRGKVSTEGVFEAPVTATSEDGLCALTIPEGTVGLTEELEPLTEITMVTMDEPPSPPEAAHIIGLAYEFGPDRATFEPAITLEYTYDPDALPEGVAEEDLVLAYYDEAAGEWVELDCVVDTENNTVTARVDHFTTFALISTVPEEEEVPPVEEEEEVPVEEEVEEVVPPEEEEVVPLVPPVPPVERPAAFAVSQLSISPAEVEVGETVTISVMVANTGDLSGSYEINLRIGGATVDTKDVTLEGGTGWKVTFTTSRDVAGTYAISVDGRQGTLVVRSEPTNWPLIGGMIAVMIVIGLIAFFLVRRRVLREV